MFYCHILVVEYFYIAHCLTINIYLSVFKNSYIAVFYLSVLIYMYLFIYLCIYLLFINVFFFS